MLFLLLIIVAVWIAIAKVLFRHEFDFIEIAIQFMVSTLVIVLVISLGDMNQTYDIKLVNGKVTKTVVDRQSCPRGWKDYRDDFCTEYRSRTVKDGEICSTDTKGNKSCTPTYKTQYKYIYSWEQKYFIHNTVSNPIEIERVDPQGANTPERFAMVKVGDPVAVEKSYTNYIKGAAESLLNQKFEEVAEIAYPRVRDYYKANRVIVTGVPVDSKKWEDWNQTFAHINSELSKTGANAILVITGHDEIWAEQLAQAWDAHNINDIVMVVGVRNGVISWADVRSWSDNPGVNIQLRNRILDFKGKTIDEAIYHIAMATLDNGLKFELQPMENFEYLAEDIPTPIWVYIVLGLFLTIINPLITLVFVRTNFMENLR